MTAAAYFDCPSGVSGDMILGALVDAGWEDAALRAVVSALRVGDCALEIAPVRRGALGATLVRVAAPPEQPERRLDDILALIRDASLPDGVKERACAIFANLAAAEARVHRVDASEVHFHEVGAVDAIVDVVGACAGLEALGAGDVFASPLPLGRGIVTAAHGPLPLPAPAVLELLARAGAPTVPHASTAELVTPTGAAILGTLARFEQPPLRLRAVGYGAGSREDPSPNVLRLWLGEVADSASKPETLLLLEANIDDMPGELFGHAMERLLASGALDAWCAPLTMKKSRPGVMLSALCRPERRNAMIDIMMRETSTFGVRVREVSRYAAARRTVEVETPFGVVRVKVKQLDGVDASAVPEYDDCRRLAVEREVALPAVYAAASAAGIAAIRGRVMSDKW